MAFSKSENERVRILCYLVIGGTAALFEWALVYLFAVRSVSIIFCQQALLIFVPRSATILRPIALFLTVASATAEKRSFPWSLLYRPGSFVWNLLLMRLFVGALGGSVMPSKILASALVTIWNYLSRKKWIYHKTAASHSSRLTKKGGFMNGFEKS